MQRCTQLCLPFLDDKTACAVDILSTVYRKEQKTWREKKRTIGLVRHDLTHKLDKTDFGFPKVKAYNADYPDILIGINEINRHVGNRQWLH